MLHRNHGVVQQHKPVGAGRGTFHHISPKHVDRYLEEFEFRFNNRNKPDVFVAVMRKIVCAEPLTFAELTGDADSPWRM